MSESIWNYFDKVEGGTGKLASCKLCDEIKNYEATVSNLKQHLSRCHRDKTGVDVKELCNLRYKSKNRTVSTDKSKSRRRTSDIWTYFEIKDSDTKTAECLLCQKGLSYKSSITNLKAHLKHKHVHQYEMLLQRSTEAADDSDEEVLYLEETDAEGSEVESRDFFELLGEEARCCACADVLPAAVADLRAHLLEKHQHGGTSLEAAPAAKRARSPHEEPPRKRLKDTDKFLAYIASLMEDLPREMCMKLQSNIVSMIVDAKLNYDPLCWNNESEFEDRKS